MMNEPRQEDEEAREANFVRNFRIGLAIPCVILLVFFLIAGLYSFVEPTTPSDKKDFIQATGVLVAGLAGVVGLFFTWRNLRLTWENTEKQLQVTRENTEKQLQVAREGQERIQKSTQETLRLTEQGQITERFTRAIDQLGATDDKGKPRLEVRIGGTYALERIARDSLTRDYSTVIKVLTAYVRENTSVPLREDAKRNSESNAEAETDKLIEQATLERPKPPSDIQAVLEVITHLKWLEDDGIVPKESHVDIDLRETNLQGADLRGAYLVGDLQGADLRGAYLRRADLRGANLMAVDLIGADLQGADLQEAKLKGGANLQGANLRGANLRAVNLHGAYLQRTDLQGANLLGAYLQQAQLVGANLQQAYFGIVDLIGADLQGANLQRAYLQQTMLPGANLLQANLRAVNLQGAYLQRAILREANLQQANLQGANLQQANLQGANLQQANLQEADLGAPSSKVVDKLELILKGVFHLYQANLKGTDLRGADLQGAEGLMQDQLEQAIGDETTNLPEGLEPPKSWTQGEGKQADNTK